MLAKNKSCCSQCTQGSGSSDAAPGWSAACWPPPWLRPAGRCPAGHGLPRSSAPATACSMKQSACHCHPMLSLHSREKGCRSDMRQGACCLHGPSQACLHIHGTPLVAIASSLQRLQDLLDKSLRFVWLLQEELDNCSQNLQLRLYIVS